MMRFLPAAVLAITVLVLNVNDAHAKKPSRSRPVTTSSRRSNPARPAATASSKAPVSRRRPVYDDEEEDELVDDGYDEAELDEEVEVELFDDDDDVEIDIRETARSTKSRRSSGNRSSSRAPPPRSSSSRARSSSGSVSKSSSIKRPPPRRYEDDYYDDEPSPRRSYASRRGPPPRRPGGRVVPYTKPGAAQNAAAAFTRGLSALRNAMPDPSSVKDAALSGLSAARETTSHLSSNIYREIKGLTSSELEQVMLKATRPDDTAVKGKHVERLVGVTYQISTQYDLYDAVLRKLWSKMAERDWRTTMKALYILHRFSADGAPEHAPNLKARLRELRRARDPKRKVKYFDTKLLLAGDSNPDNIKFRAFMSRYAHYVMLRAQCFCGLFEEIAHEPKPSKKKKVAPKPITSTSLHSNNLNAARVLLKAGVLCHLKAGEECENTAIAAERVAADMIGLTTAVAIALNRALKDDDLKGADPALLKQWCIFYSEELLPETKAMVKKTSPKLDAYGLFLPSRMGATVSRDLLEKGLHLEEDQEEAKSEPSAQVETESGDASEAQDSVPVSEVTSSNATAEPRQNTEPLKEEEVSEIEDEAIEEEAEFDDEYEYEEEEYYDEEE